MQVTLFCICSSDDFCLEINFAICETEILKVLLAEKSNCLKLSKAIAKVSITLQFLLPVALTQGISPCVLIFSGGCQFDFRML